MTENKRRPGKDAELKAFFGLPLSRGIKTAKGGEWSLIQLQRVLARLPVAA